MSAMNNVKNRLGGVAAMLGPYKSMISLGLYIFVALIVLLLIYSFLYPAPDPFQQVVINQTMPTYKLKNFKQQLFPPMTTGGEYTFQTWMYINNLDYKPGKPKHVFSIRSDGPAGGAPSHASIVGVLSPEENSLMIRIYQDPNGSQASQSAGPDLTVDMNFRNLFQGRLPGQGAGMAPVCDIRQMDAQRWVHIAIVVNGRMVDVYVDGKISRSCVTPGIPIIDPGKNFLTVGANGGWGGSVSTTRFYGYALTPAAVHALYEQGPAPIPDQNMSFFAKLLNAIGFTTDQTPALTLPPPPIDPTLTPAQQKAALEARTAGAAAAYGASR
jgi:hypothetical protein